MGQVNSELQQAFQQDGFTGTQYYTYGHGLGAIAKKQDQRIIYVRGTPYELGFLMGMLCHQEIEEICTVYIPHMIPHFISEDFDRRMKCEPILFQLAYKVLLEIITDIIVRDSVVYFQASLDQGSIPGEYLRELTGIYEGCHAKQTMSHVSMSRLIAANYGLDYLMITLLSGRLFRQIETIWNEVRQEYPTLPPFHREFLAPPDMCNAALLSGRAAPDGPFLLRDFQFYNARMFDTSCTHIIRHPTGKLLSCVVGIPGFIGGVTVLNEKGLACGFNMVRSEAVSLKNMGMGAMMTIRYIADNALSVEDMETKLRTLSRGCAWIYYGVDSREYRVFETITNDYPILAKIPPQLKRWYQEVAGVWSRTEVAPVAPRQLFEWSRQLKPPYDLTLSQWTGAAMSPDWKTDRKMSAKLSNMYFPPWRQGEPGICVATNSFLNPLLRVTQMNEISRFLERVALCNQWRYDTLMAKLQAQYGHLTRESCQEIIQFLSPKNVPDYPENTTNQLRGALSVVDTRNLIITSKYGTWDSPWVQLDLHHYLKL